MTYSKLEDATVNKFSLILMGFLYCIAHRLLKARTAALTRSSPPGQTLHGRWP